jgi:hypothetical protein
MYCLNRLLFVVLLGLTCLAPLGCGGRTPTKVMRGSVTCGGEKVPMGQVVFVPGDTSQPPSAAAIVDGQYLMDAGGGVRLGKYRVRVDARKKTGRQVKANNGFEITMTDEVIPVGPAIYAGDRSPLSVEVAAASNGTFDIAIPRQ